MACVLIKKASKKPTSRWMSMATQRCITGNGDVLSSGNKAQERRPHFFLVVAGAPMVNTCELVSKPRKVIGVKCGDTPCQNGKLAVGGTDMMPSIHPLPSRGIAST